MLATEEGKTQTLKEAVTVTAKCYTKDRPLVVTVVDSNHSSHDDYNIHDNL